MAGLGKVSISIDVEPIVKLMCGNETCRFNLIHSRDAVLYCGLKYVELNAAGCCALQEPRQTLVGDKSITPSIYETREPSQPPPDSAPDRPVRGLRNWQAESGLARLFRMYGA